LHIQYKYKIYVCRDEKYYEIQVLFGVFNGASTSFLGGGGKKTPLAFDVRNLIDSVGASGSALLTTQKRDEITRLPPSETEAFNCTAYSGNIQQFCSADEDAKEEVSEKSRCVDYFS
jgi:hypothetical protein